VSEGLPLSSVVSGVVQSANLATVDVKQNAEAVAKVADAPLAAEVAANAAGETVNKLALSNGASPAVAEQVSFTHVLLLFCCFDVLVVL
jgi:hypothetical protein